METKIYKRTFLNFIKNMIYAILGPIALLVFLFVVIGNLWPNASDMVTVGMLVFCFALMIGLIYRVIFSQNIRVELTAHELNYFVRGNLKKTFPLADYEFGYVTKSSGGTTDEIDLKYLHIPTGEEGTLDLEPIGAGQFHKLYDSIEELQKQFKQDEVIYELPTE